MRRRVLVMVGGLLAVLVVAVVVILGLRGGRDDSERLLGGPLLDFDPTEVTQIIVTEGGRQHRLVRGEGLAWSLRGALHDWVDPLLLAYRMADLAQAQGGAILAGTVPEDRRYEFNGPQAVRLTLRMTDGREIRLAMGAVNPVTGHVYASGAGRPGCFPVLPETRDLVADLGQSVRVKTLLPRLDPDRLEGMDLVWGTRTLRFERAAGHWWLRVESLDDPALPELARNYQRHYDDRRRTDESGLMVQASRAAVLLFIDDVGASPAQQLAPVESIDLARLSWGLETVWRQVILRGTGLDPDPMADDPDLVDIVFGEPLDAKTIGAQRRGLPLLAGATPVLSLERPLHELVDTRALTPRIMDADTVTLAGAGGVLLRAGHDRTVQGRFDGRSEWHAVDQVVSAGDQRDPDDSARFLVVELDRLACLAVLPPTADPAVLEAEEQLRLTIVWNDPPDRREYRIGVLNPARVPGSGAALVPTEDDTGPVGLWRAADGRLLQIPGGLVVTGRNLAR